MDHRGGRELYGHIYIHGYVQLSVYLLICLFTDLFICLYVHLFVYLPTHTHTHARAHFCASRAGLKDIPVDLLQIMQAMEGVGGGSGSGFRSAGGFYLTRFWGSARAEVEVATGGMDPTEGTSFVALAPCPQHLPPTRP